MQKSRMQATQPLIIRIIFHLFLRVSWVLCFKCKVVLCSCLTVLKYQCAESTKIEYLETVLITLQRNVFVHCEMGYFVVRIFSMQNSMKILRLSSENEMFRGPEFDIKNHFYGLLVLFYFSLFFTTNLRFYENH